jgi:hypothetical protein
VSDFTNSLRDVPARRDGKFKPFLLELFDRVNDLHDEQMALGDEAKIEQAYYQGKKDAIRIVLAFYLERDVDLLNRSSVFHEMRSMEGKEAL